MVEKVARDQLVDKVIELVRYVGEKFSDDDVVYHDQSLELLVPAISRVFLKYAESGSAFITQKQAMIQIFDVITRFVEDPSLIPDVDLRAVLPHG